jgi:His/Glu/Gln/Arg/opine family amino acid ABC transporter permease subunit
MSEIVVYIPLIVQGTFVTVAAWLCSAFLSFSVGILLGLFSSRQLSPRWVQWLLRMYAFVAKGIPAYVQILIAYFLLPSLFGVSVPGFVAAVCALAFCSSGYVFEIVRAGVHTIPKGQWDACYVLGYSKKDAIMRIIAPQVLTAMLPAFIGELEQLLKSTSLFATIGVTELTRTGMNIISRELNPVPVYILIACLYLIFSFLLLLLSLYVDNKRKRFYGAS